MRCEITECALGISFPKPQNYPFHAVLIFFISQGIDTFGDNVSEINGALENDITALSIGKIPKY